MRDNTDDGSVDQLISGCIAGDRRCQRALFRQYRERVYNLVCRMLGPEFDADDVIQQVFIRLFKSLGGFQKLSSLDTWVYRIAAKVCTDQLRGKYRKRTLKIVPDSQQAVDAEGDAKYDPYLSLEQKEQASHISDALRKIGDEKRTVIVLHDVEQKSLEQIAEVIQKPVGTVKSRLFHARKELQKLLGRYLSVII